jgi:hypothetical protein
MEDECSICLERMKKNIITLDKCNHRFHKQCFKNYVTSIVDKNKESVDCPLCRQPTVIIVIKKSIDSPTLPLQIENENIRNKCFYYSFSGAVFIVLSIVVTSIYYKF